MFAHKIKETINVNVLDSVRQGFCTVSRMARHVKVREDLIPAYADNLPDMSPDNVLDENHHFMGDPETTAAYILILDGINFGSGYRPYMIEEGWQLIGNSIYFTLSTHLKNYFEKKGDPSASQLSVLSMEECIGLLQLNKNGHYSAEFAQLCRQSLQGLGQMVMAQYEGSFLDFVRGADHSAEKMVAMLSRMPHFNDVHEYRGHIVPFYKRAQITAADLHLAFGRLGEDLFRDINHLTMFPDNAVPHVLHVDGLLEYSHNLSARIQRGEDIKSGTEEEIEIRACAGYVVEKLAAYKKMIAMDIDHILWHKSVEDSLYQKSLSHRTLSELY